MDEQLLAASRCLGLMEERICSQHEGRQLRYRWRDKRKQCSPPSQKKKSVWELKPERRDDYFSSQLSERLSSLLLTSSIHLAHVNHAQHFRFGTFVARHRGRPTEKTPWPPGSKTLPASIQSLLLLLQSGAAAPPAAQLQYNPPPHTDSVIQGRMTRD